MEKTISSSAYCLMAIGLCLIIVCFSNFVVVELYGGGVLEYRGRLPEIDEDLPENVDYALFQFGRITPLSEAQYRFLSRYARMSEISGIVGLCVWGLGCLLVVPRLAPYRGDLPTFRQRAWLAEGLLKAIVKNRVLLILVVVCASVFLLSFVMSMLNATGRAFWRAGG